MSDLMKTNETSNEVVRIGYDTVQGFELMQRVAKALSKSTIVPKNYQDNISDCMIALNMSQRIKADPLMVMQNLHIIYGRPSFSASFLIATLNASGRFSSLQYEFRGTKGKEECRAYAKEIDSGNILYGSWISMDMAKAEGWYDKSGSKWKTMPQQMLMYRSATFFIRAYAPEIMMGMSTTDEIEDIVDVDSYKVVESERDNALNEAEILDLTITDTEKKEEVVDEKPLILDSDGMIVDDDDQDVEF